MPILVALCDKCNSDFETIQSYKVPLPPCPTCGGETRHGLGNVSARFGLGFARDGYISVGKNAKAAIAKGKDEASRGPQRGRKAINGF